MHFAMISRLLGLRCLMSLEDTGTGRDCSENTRHVEDRSGCKLVLKAFLSEYKKWLHQFIFVYYLFLLFYTASSIRMHGNKARRFTKIQYQDPQDNEIIDRTYISSEKHTINSILRNLISNVEFIAILPGVLKVNWDTDVMDSEMIRALQEHLMSEQRLEMLEDHNLVSDGKNENTPLEKNVKISLKNLLRLVKARPLLLSAWKKELPKEIGKCERCLIKEIHVLEGLEPRQAAPKLPVSYELNNTALLQDFPATIEEVTTKVRSVKIKVRHELNPAQSTSAQIWQKITILYSFCV